MKRRDLIKTLAFSPFLLNGCIRSFVPRSSFLQSPVQNKVFILLHGLFFLEYQNNKLVVTAPGVADHDYQIGTPDNDGTDLRPIPASTTLDFSQGMGLSGDPNFMHFAPELLQFSKTETGVGDLTGPFRFRCVLPCPVDIVPLRNGPRSDLHCKPGGIFSSINNHPSSKITLVTCLVYNGSVAKIHPTSTNRCHFYAEPDFEPDLVHTNKALTAAKSVFARGDKFDLQLDTSVLTQDLPLIPAKVPKDDDPRVILSGVFEEDPLFAVRSLNSAQAAASGQGSSAKPWTRGAEAVNVANCGQYGVTNP